MWQTALLDLPAGFWSEPNYSVHLTLDGTLLYAILSRDDKGQVEALDARTGHILWKHTEDANPISLTMTIAANGICYLAVGPKPTTVGGETLKALDGQSGKLLWTVSTGEYSFGQIAVSSKAVYLIQQKFVPTTLRSNGPPNLVVLHALRLADGTELWQKEVENTVGQTAISYVATDLQADDQAVYLVKMELNVETTPAGLTSRNIRTLIALRANDGAPLWSVKDPQDDPPDVSTGANLVLFDQALYLIGGYHMSLFNAQDGKVLGAFQSPFYLWLFVPKDSLYALTPATEVCLLRSSDGTQRWCSAISVPSTSTPGVVGTENVYLFGYQQSQPQERAIYVLRQSDGSQVGRYTLGDPTQVILYSMVLADGH